MSLDKGPHNITEMKYSCAINKVYSNFEMNMTFILLSKANNLSFMSCKDINEIIIFLNSPDEIKVIFTPKV